MFCSFASLEYLLKLSQNILPNPIQHIKLSELNRKIHAIIENNFNQIKTSSKNVAPNPQNNWVIGLGYAHTF